MFRTLFILFVPFLLLALYSGCDANITGSPIENEPPNTALSVRDTSLLDNLGNDERLPSTVFVSWSGDDPDGFVSYFELRFFSSSEVVSDPESGWIRTTSNDTLVLLPIPPGSKDADVTFEVRAVDNVGLADPSPARTVFPIENAPPTIRLRTFDLPPDTTFQVVSIGWEARDPEGLANLSRIDIGLNDSLNFTGVPAEFDFITLVGQIDIDDPAQTTAEARVFLGRGFQSSEIRVPGMQLDADNTIYLRAVDLTDTTSVLERYTWHVKKQSSDILYVNDWRKSNLQVLLSFHINLLKEYLPTDKTVDVYDITVPYLTGAAGNVPRSELLPSNASPSLEHTFALFNHIYWVATSTTNNVQRNNFPFAAGVLDRFFDQGGSLMMHSAVTLPPDPEDNLGNPAILLLPMTGLITFPDTLRQQLRLRPGASVTPIGSLPGVSAPLPQLTFSSFDINTLPYLAGGANIIPLYEATYTYVTRANNQGDWTGPSTVASISADRRIGLFAIPLINEQSAEPILLGLDGEAAAGREAIKLMLESLEFPKR